MHRRINLVKRDIQIIALIIVCMSLFIFSVNPKDLPVVGLLTIPVGASIIGYFFANIILSFTFDINKSTRVMYCLAFSSLILVMFMLGALKQLGVQDLLLVSAFVGGLTFYLRRASTSF